MRNADILVIFLCCAANCWLPHLPRCDLPVSRQFVRGQVLGAGRFFGSALTEENTAAVERVELELREAMAGDSAPPVCRQPLQPGQLVAVQGVEDAGR